MKKCFKLFVAALMSLALSVSAMANEALTVCEGTNTSHYVPFSNLDYQSGNMHSQLIYPAATLAAMSGQQINTVTFYLNGTLHADGGMLVVKMGETSKTVFSNGSDFCTDLTQVAQLPLTEGVTELVIELSSPYMYQGGNLVMDFTVAEVGDDNFYAWDYFYGVQQPSTQYTAIGSDGLLNNFLPKATFDYGVPQDWDAKVTPLELNFNIPAEREEVQTITIMNKGLNAFTPVISSLAAPLSIEVEPVELTTGQSLEIPVKFAPDQVCNCSERLTIDCGEAGTFEVIINAIATDPVYEVTAADGSDQDMYLPFYGYYYDTMGTFGQMIYTEEMMGATKGNKITKVTFYPTTPLGFMGGQLQLSFKVVDQTGFVEETAITEMTAVATLTPVLDATELVFVLNEPFEYNGGNLAIEANVIESANYKSTKFYGTKMNYDPSFYHYVNYSGVEVNSSSDFLPKATFTYEKAEAPEFMRGDVDNNGEVKIADVTALINYLLSNDAAGISLQAADCDQNGEIKIGDVTALINFLLSGSWD